MKLAKNQSIVLLCAVAVMALVLVYNHFRAATNDNAAPPPPIAQIQGPSVQVITVKPQSYQAQLSGFGSAVAHYSLTLSSQLSGHITDITPALEAGNTVASGQLLAQLEDSAYLAAVAAAEQTLAEAKLNYLQEELQARQALAEWQASGLSGEPDSELVLRQPQLAAAKATMLSAQTSLAKAHTELQQTRITAPFDALVTTRSISPGSVVQSGTEIATLLSTDRVEVTIALSAQDWAALPPTTELLGSDWQITLQQVETKQQWQASVIRAEQHLDDSTRQRALIAAVFQPLAQSEPLLPGSFLQASIPGKKLDNLWRLPASALSQRGEIWYVRSDNTLDNLVATPVFTDQNAIYITAPAALAQSAQAILVQPLSSYLKGMAVTPIEGEQYDHR